MVAKGNLGMDKKYMLDAVRARLSELNNNYRYAGDRNLKAESLKVFRSRTKREIYILKLVEELLTSPCASEIFERDAIKGFDKLVKEI